jgi:hypothetical protein
VSQFFERDVVLCVVFLSATCFAASFGVVWAWRKLWGRR